MEESTWEAWVLVKSGGQFCRGILDAVWMQCLEQCEAETRGVSCRTGLPWQQQFPGQSTQGPVLVGARQRRSQLGSGAFCKLLVALCSLCCCCGTWELWARRLWGQPALGESCSSFCSDGTVNKKLKIILNYFCGSQTKPQKLFIQALTKCDKIPFIKGVSKVGQFLYGLIFFLY